MSEPKAYVDVPWGKVIGFAVLIAGVLYAVEHPNSFLSVLIKVLIVPVPEV